MNSTVWIKEKKQKMNEDEEKNYKNCVVCDY